MLKGILILFVIVFSMDIYSSNPMRFFCEDQKDQTFEIQIFDLEYNLAFLNRSNQEQIVLSFNQTSTHYYSKDYKFIIVFNDLSEVDEDGDGIAKGFYIFQEDIIPNPITCKTFGF